MEDHQIVALFEHRAEIAVEETAKKYGAIQRIWFPENSKAARHLFR